MSGIKDANHAARVLAELQRRAVQATLVDCAFPKQREFIDDPSKLKAALCTRRAGKSYGVGISLLDEALKHPDTACLYVGLTRESAKRVLFPVLRELNRKHKLRGTFNINDLSVRFPNGSIVYLIGVNADPKEKEKILGQKFRLVVIDESASYTIDLEELVYAVIKPAVADYNGVICLIGTPGNTKNFFHDITTEDRGWSVHKWSAFDNPHMATQMAQEIADLKAINPLVVETPRFKQHYLGEWCIDESALVYKFDATRNLAPELPADHTDWLYTLAIDLGYEDATAWVVAAFSPTDRHKRLYLVDAQKESHLNLTQVAGRTQDLIDLYKPYARIVDNAAKQSVAELNDRYGLMLEPATKQGKFDAITMMNADLIIGRIKLLPTCKDLVEEWENLVWDERHLTQGKHVEHSACDNHLSDAALYAWRRAFNFNSREPVVKKRPVGEEQIDAWWAKQEDAIANEKSDEWWDASSSNYLNRS